MLHNLGRETFLAPVKWQDSWPVVGNNGRMEEEMEGPLPAASTAGLCTEGTMYMTFTGTYLAMFAENGTAVFDSFEVKNNPE